MSDIAYIKEDLEALALDLAAGRVTLAEASRRYYAANPEKERERQRRYREANPEKVRERHRRYGEANPGKVLKKATQRRLVLSGIPRDQIPEELLEAKVAQILVHRAIKKRKKQCQPQT